MLPQNKTTTKCNKQNQANKQKEAKSFIKRIDVYIKQRNQ